MKTYAQIIQQHAALHGTHEGQVEELVEEQEQPVKYITEANSRWRLKLPTERITWTVTTHTSPYCSVGLNDYNEDGIQRDNTGLFPHTEAQLAGLKTKPCHKCRH